MRREVFFLRTTEESPEKILVERRGSRYRVLHGESAEELDAARLPDGRLSLLFEDARQFCGRGISRGRDGVEVVAGGRSRRIPIGRTRQEGAGRLAVDPAAGGVEEIRALMHGRIIEVRFAPGGRVEAGELLLVLEAMKMQNEIRASRPGVVERSDVAAGQTVEGGAFMLSIRSDCS